MTPLRQRFSIRAQLLALFGLLLLTGFIVLTLDEFALRAEIETFHDLRNESLSGLRLAKSISDTYRLDIVDTTFRVRNSLMGWDQGLSIVSTAQSDIDRDWRALLATNLTTEERQLALSVTKARALADAATRKLEAILKAHDIVALGKFADTEMYPAMDPVTTRLQFLTDIKLLDAERSVREHLAGARAIGWWRIGISFAVLLFVFLVGRGILRSVYKGIRRLVLLARRARNRTFVPDWPKPEGELGQIHEALMTMRQELIAYESNLSDSEARATAANKAKTSFLAAMSHEIRTPMVGVTGMLELLARTQLDAEQRQQVEIVQSSAHSLLQIIGDILDFSKIEAGKLELQLAPLDLRALVRNTTDNFLATASNKGLRLDCDIDARLAPAHLGDAMRLRQILANFLSNALKFTERGSVQVRVERLAVEGQRELVALRVVDTGIGVSAADKARLFQPFTQADMGMRRGDGSGLGLSICRHLAGLMGGEIALESQLGVGTTLSLVLRLPQVDAALLAHKEAPALVPSRRAPDIDTAAREGSLILLADDHPTNRAVITRQLNQLGYACETAADGDAALQLWQTGRYALLLTDLHMPHRDGYALAEAIRAGERESGHAAAPIVALSANVSTEEVERSRAAGIDDFLAKPTPLALLGNVLNRYLPLQRFVMEEAALAAVESARPVSQVATPDRELIDDYLRATREDLAALQGAIDSKDAKAMLREAHRIRGAAGLVGANEVAAIAARIEATAREGALQNTPADAAALAAAVQRFAASVN